MDKGNFKIRLDKIDAPEKKQAFGNKAKQFFILFDFRQARAEKKGLWADPNPVNPCEFRKMKNKRWNTGEG